MLVPVALRASGCPSGRCTRGFEAGCSLCSLCVVDSFQHEPVGGLSSPDQVGGCSGASLCLSVCSSSLSTLTFMPLSGAGHCDCCFWSVWLFWACAFLFGSHCRSRLVLVSSARGAETAIHRMLSAVDAFGGHLSGMSKASVLLGAQRSAARAALALLG